MTAPTKLLVAGDTHGDANHVYYLFDRALNNDCDAIVQVGDFGYWEHAQGGAAFLDFCSDLAVNNNIPLFWIDGNHENHTMLRGWYGPGGGQYNPTREGFWAIRDGVYYIPRGTFWTWNGVTLMGLGGAYSVDKHWRIIEQMKGGPELWWGEEEITEEEVALAKANAETNLKGERLDILFTHDKPRGSMPGWNRKDYAECFPGQDKIQELVKVAKPRLLVHGHLHYRYTDQIRCGDDGEFTTVVGLDCNADAQSPNPNNQNARASWEILELQKNVDKEEV